MRKIRIGLIVLCVVALLAVGVAIFNSGSDTVPTEYQKWETTEGANMADAVAAIFDINNLNTAYDWVVTEDIDGAETLIETSVFNVDGTTYEYLLASLKSDPSDELYGISKYLVLTVTTPKEVVVFIDLSTDGVLDSVYVNDVALKDAVALTQAQAQYEFALRFSQSSLIAAR